MSMHSTMNSDRRFTVTLKNKGHEAFCKNYLPRCQRQDVYHKVLIYYLGISGDTRQNVEGIYDYDRDPVKTECLGKGWITSGSVSVLRIVNSFSS